MNKTIYLTGSNIPVINLVTRKYSEKIKYKQKLITIKTRYNCFKTIISQFKMASDKAYSKED